jgi:hypothetical protein
MGFRIASRIAAVGCVALVHNSITIIASNSPTSIRSAQKSVSKGVYAMQNKYAMIVKKQHPGVVTSFNTAQEALECLAIALPNDAHRDVRYNAFCIIAQHYQRNQHAQPINQFIDSLDSIIYCNETYNWCVTAKTLVLAIASHYSNAKSKTS